MLFGAWVNDEFRSLFDGKGSSKELEFDWFLKADRFNVDGVFWINVDSLLLMMQSFMLNGSGLSEKEMFSVRILSWDSSPILVSSLSIGALFGVLP